MTGGGEELCDEESDHCFFFANISYVAFKEPLSKDHCYTVDRCKNPPPAPLCKLPLTQTLTLKTKI